MDLATGLALVSTTAVVAGVVFAGLQVRNARLARTREAETVLTQSFQSPEFMRAMDLVTSLPPDLTHAEIFERVGDQYWLVSYWVAAMENIGVLVFHGQIRLQVVEDFFSGPIVLSWRILRRALQERRAALGRVTMYEWFQWLAERIEAHEAGEPPVPAYVEHARWRT